MTCALRRVRGKTAFQGELPDPNRFREFFLFFENSLPDEAPGLLFSP
jgi:hypothetical protein